MTEQPSTPPMGERRRRREAERRRAQETGEGLTPPMTRRERRALEEALASGALELTPDGQYAPTGELPVTTTGQHVLSGMETAASAEQEDAQVGSPAGAPERQSWRDTAQEVEALRPPPTMEPVPDGAASAAQVRSPGSAGSAEEPAESGRVSRRSLRERRDDTGPALPERPSERTATGRRPVIRPPASALGTRSVDDATGELTAIQRAIRDINAAPDEPVTDSELHAVDTGSPAAPSPEAISAASPEKQSPAAATPDPATTSAGSASSAPSATSSEEPGADTAVESPSTVASPSSSSPEEDEVDDSFDMSPRWPSVAAAAEQAVGSTPEDDPDNGAAAPPEPGTFGRDAPPAQPPTAPDSEPEPGSDAAPEDEDPDELTSAEDDDERHTPRLLQVLYWLVLVLAGLVLGLLVWRMATGDLFGDDDALATAGRWLVLRQ